MKRVLMLISFCAILGSSLMAKCWYVPCKPFVKPKTQEKIKKIDKISQKIEKELEQIKKEFKERNKLLDTAILNSNKIKILQKKYLILLKDINNKLSIIKNERKIKSGKQ